MKSKKEKKFWINIQLPEGKYKEKLLTLADKHGSMKGAAENILSIALDKIK